MKTKKNFHIVRHYLNGECLFAVNLTESQAVQYGNFVETLVRNEAGGITVWYRIELDPKVY
jgi:hypothetical protein